MNSQTKRKLYSWLLLAVYLPMLLISSLHFHELGDASETTCSECVQHQCHGHLSQFTGELHQCMLCQILTLTYVAATTGAVVLFLSPKRIVRERQSQAVCLNTCGVVSLRAPPMK